MAPTNLKLGRRAPLPDRPRLKLANVLTGVVPAHPAAVDHLNIGGWQMLGNDQYGDCVSVTWANVRRLMTRLAGTERYPDLNAVIEFYKTQNPGFPSEDNGMVIQLALEALVANGGPDGTKAVAFAQVDHTNPDEVKAAIAIFGYVWTGINVQAAQMDQFGAGQVWDYVAGSPDEGGHSIIVAAYDSDGVGADEQCVTWAKETGWTDSFWGHQVEEAWVVIWPEHLGSQAFQQGVDVAQLASDYQAITGKPFPAPVPTPPAPTPTPPAPTPTPGPTPQPPAPTPPPVNPPTPNPTPVPNSADDALAQVALPWVRHRHVGSNNDMKHALRVWLVDKGYASSLAEVAEDDEPVPEGVA